MATSSVTVTPGEASRLANRWVQLAIGIIGMVMIANLQYGWTLFVNPIAAKFHWTKTEIQVAFTLFVLTETWLVPFGGYLVDRFGPSLLVALGGVLVGLAWVVNAHATSLTLLYAGGLVGGVGAGIVYGTAVGNALKWFTDRRGLAAGLTAAGFGAGSALTIIPIYNMIKHSGYQSTFLFFGILQGTVVLIAAAFLRAPRAGDVTAVARPKVAQSGRDFTWQETVQQPAFWVLYVMFTMAATGGLMATAQLGVMAKDYKVADIPVSLLGITLAALPFALSLDRILNGATRPFFGWVSDHIGRENTMFIAFATEGLAIILLLRLAHIPVMFVVLSGLVFFAWGEIYSLFPAITGDLFGQKYATTNYGVLYTAKGTASLLVPIGSALQGWSGSWVPIFAVAIVFDFTAALLALFVLKPLRANVVSQAMSLERKVETRTRELTRSVQELKALADVSQEISAALNRQTLLGTIVSRAVQLVGADGGAIYEYQESTQEFHLRATNGMEDELVRALQTNPVRLGEGAIGQAAATREAVHVPDILASGTYPERLRDLLARFGFRDIVALPLLREDQIVGALVVRRKVPGELRSELIDLLRTFATHSALAIQNARLFHESEERGRQLEIATRHKSQFLAHMSHELRTPMNAILGYTELILDNEFGELNDDLRDVLERIQKSGRHLLGLINDVLDLSKIEAGQFALTLSEYSMQQVVQAVSTAVHPLASAKRVDLTCTVSPDLPHGWGDERRITQVLLNLVGNAIKFTDTGTVTVLVAAQNGAFMISVADTGPGIPEADQQKIFDEFHQADSSHTRAKGGTGLGLAIAKRIVEMHGGRIGVDSAPGKGSTFWFVLPVRAEQQGGVT